MNISKKIIIKEWMTNKRITAETLTTDSVGDGSLIWVPWDARGHVGELDVSHNGEYLAADEGLFGWTKVNVMVAGGDDAEIETTNPDGTTRTEWVRAPSSTKEDNIGYGSGAVVGEMDGVTYEVTVDDDGYLVWTTQSEDDDEEEDGLVWVEQDVLDAISEAINEKTGGTGDYKPSQMPRAIRNIKACTLSTADDGKVVQGGQLVGQSTIRITQNGTYDTTTKSEALVTVSGGMEFEMSDVGKVVVSGDSGYELAGQTTLNVSENGTYDTTSKNVTVVDIQVTPPALDTKSITENGTYDASSDNLDGYSQVTVNVAGASIDAADEGKVVINGSLVSQVPMSISANGTYDTTGNNSVSVAVAGGNSRPYYIHDDTITMVDESEHEYDWYLTDIVMSGVSYVGKSAFARCRHLSGAWLSNCGYVEDSAFFGCNDLRYAHLEQCSYIGFNAFRGCASLEHVYLDSCEMVQASGFMNCSSLESISMPACEYIGPAAFYGCKNLQTASLPNCSTVGWSAFAACSALTEISLPKCTEIAPAGFLYCSAMSRAILPKCKSVGSTAFFGCENLTLVSFGEVNSIGSLAFGNCLSLMSVYVGCPSVPTLESSDAFSTTPITQGGSGRIYVPSSLYQSFRTARNWSNYSYAILSY